MKRISRREAIRHVTLLLGGTALVGGTALLAAEEPDRSRTDRSLFTPPEIDWLDEVAETILPETGTPGAKAAEVGAFVALMVTDVYGEPEQGIFRDGMGALEDRCMALHGKGFLAAAPEQRLALLEELDLEQKRYMDAKKEDDPAHWFRMMMLKALGLGKYRTAKEKKAR